MAERAARSVKTVAARRAGSGLSMQRKYACGAHAPGRAECDGCRRRRVQRKIASAASAPPDRAIPSIVGKVLSSEGEPLRREERRYMEERFGQDFAAVRVHADARAAQSAREVGAQAYAVGQHIVLGQGMASIQGRSGRSMLAHELAHTLQQPSFTGMMPQVISDPAGASEHAAHAVADRVASGLRVPSMQLHAAPAPTLFRLPLPDLDSSRKTGGVPATLPGHGPNPGDCMEANCATMAQHAAPTSDTEALALIDSWEQQTLACLRAGGPASKASHQAEIVANDEGEIQAAAARLRTVVLPGLGKSADRYRYLADDLKQKCINKAREVHIEFQYNVAFDNPPAATSVAWDYGKTTWDSVEDALSALPASATWGNPRLIVFRRAACHPDDLDASGNCSGNTGGETNLINPARGDVTAYDAGLDAKPYARSKALGVSSTQQTLRHEVGHVMESEVPRDERERFFRDILPWDDFSWVWISQPNPRYPNWKAEREKLRALLGFDEAHLTTWLAALAPGVPVKVGQRTYTRDTKGPGGSTNFLSAIDESRLPKGQVFDYARTSTGEYFAEIYALAVSRPGFIHDVLPADQIEWFKRVVFHIPSTPEAWARELAMRDRSDSGSLLPRLMRVFTWEQAAQILDEQSLAGDARRA